MGKEHGIYIHIYIHMVHCVVHLQLTQHCKSATSITKDSRSFHPVITFTHRWSCGIGYKVFHWVTLGHYCLRLGHRGSGKNKSSGLGQCQPNSSPPGEGRLGKLGRACCLKTMCFHILHYLATLC